MLIFENRASVEIIEYSKDVESAVVLTFGKE
jgi:hypothetical protein